MTESTLLLEVGSEALLDLTTAEKTAILALFTDAQVRQAGMKTFDLLRKKFLPTYKMGSSYEELSAKYKSYDKRYKEYAQSVNAGKLAVTPTATDFTDETAYPLERYKWVAPTRE